MSDRRRILLLILILIGVVGASCGTAIFLLYRASFAETSVQLAEMAQRQVRLLEAVAGHARRTHAEDPATAALEMIRTAHVTQDGIHPGSEIRFARRDGDSMLFLLEDSRPDPPSPRTLPLNSRLAEPMRRALAGETGTCVAQDLRDITVLAAFRPISSLGWGVVTKTDLAAIRQPFIVAAVVAAGISLLLTAVGAWWFFRVTQPWIDHLRASEAMLNDTGRMARVGGWSIDPAAGSLTWTREIYAIHEVAPGFVPTIAAAIGFYTAASRPLISAAVERAMRHGEAFDLVLEIVTAQGRNLWVRAIGGATTGDGAARLVHGTFQDITAEKQATDEIRRLNENLELRVLERTAELEAANRELEAFSYSVSHDLRSPLRAIAGFSTALEEDVRDRLDATGIRYLAVIRRETERMGELIDDLLRLSRLTRNPLNREEVDLSAMAAGIGAEVRQRHPGRAVVLSIADGLAVHADQGMMRIALENLLANAWKFTGRLEQAHIELAGLPDGAAGFLIRDDGVGFDMAYADRLFGAFQRLHDHREFPGTGIGLATVARIVRRHGGGIRAESAPDRGATFFISLP